MLFKLSLNNIRRSIRDYAVYFFTLIIGVSIFYAFNSLSTQAAYLRLENDEHDMIELLKDFISGVSVFVAIVLGLLIVYANRFLMKRRNKEFALYLIMGMSKRRISKILLAETAMIGAGSLIAGLILGIGLSQLMAALTANLFDADMSAYKFTVSSSAVVKTGICFAIMYVVVMILNVAVIGKCRLIDLLNSGKRSEKIKHKKMWICVPVFLISAAVLAYEYFVVGWHMEKLSRERFALIIAGGAVCTFLLFWSVSGMILRIVMSLKGMYYRSLNSFTFRQISSKINTNVMSMTIICLMLFITICLLSSAFTVRNSMRSNIEKYCPADFEVTYSEIEGGETGFDGIPVFVDIEEMYKQAGCDLTSNMEEYVHFHKYKDPALTLESFCGEYAEEAKVKFPFISWNSVEEIVKLSDYNKIMELYGRDKLELADNEFVVICNFDNALNLRNAVLSKGFGIKVFGRELVSKTDECVDSFIDLSAQHVNDGIIIIPDSAADERFASVDEFIGNYKAADKEGKNVTDKIKREEYKKAYDTYIGKYAEESGHAFSCGIDTKVAISNNAVGLGAIVTFVCLYIGLIFLISCAAILALKHLSDSADSIERYEMLRKIGAGEKEITASLFRQTGIFFIVPLILAAVHSVFGMKFACVVLGAIGTEGMAASVFITVLMILAIYGGYFLITFFCSRYIIKSRRS
ncbi:MAG: ABC transporter permease [Ruminococcus sp.]|nr:ABC transporter permease [Ruminococcus sp.]